MPSIWTRRPLAPAGVAVVAGVLLAPTGWGPVAGAGLALWLALARGTRAGPALLLTAFLAGHAAERRVAIRTERILARAPWPRAPPAAATCEFVAVSCEEDPFRGRAWCEGRRGDGTGLLCFWPGRLPVDLAPGARVRVAGRFYPPGTAGNPGESDARRRLAERGIELLADLRTVENVEVLAPGPRGLADRLGRARRAAARRIAERLPADVAPIAAALVLGVRSGLAPDDRLLFERTGTLHVLAISGMHVLLLAGCVHACLRAFGAGPRTAAGATLVLALLYVPVAGGAPPVRRAVAVLVFYGVALVRGRPPDAGSALGGAALVLALHDPTDVGRVGFRLSFAAAAGIAWLAGAWRDRWSRRHRLLRRFPAVRKDRRLRLVVAGYVLGAFPVSLAAWCATQGLVAHAFGVVTPLAPLTNVVVGPCVALLLPLSALVAVGLPGAALPAAACARGLRAVLEGAATVPGGFAAVVPPGAGPVALWMVGCVALRGAPWRGVATLAAATVLAGAAASPSGALLAVLDVGHGQAVLARFPDGASVLVDAGSATRPHVFDRSVRPALRALGIRRLAAVVCTHADSDHWNALPDLLEVMEVDRLVVGTHPPRTLVRRARARGCRVDRAAPGDAVYAVGDARLEVLAASGPGNDGSVALVFRAAGRAQVLLPADREDAGLRELLDRGVPSCPVLVAPHHGARCTAAGALGRAVRPRVLVVSARRNFDDPATVRAYGAARVCETWRDGCVTLRFPGRGVIRLTTHRGGAAVTIAPP